eukprot:8185633-Pyramimonas_sp.AAC.1
MTHLAGLAAGDPIGVPRLAGDLAVERHGVLEHAEWPPGGHPVQDGLVGLQTEPVRLRRRRSARARARRAPQHLHLKPYGTTRSSGFYQ